MAPAGADVLDGKSMTGSGEGVPPSMPKVAAPRWRRHIPTTLQIEATECGAAVLHMVLAGFGRHVPLEQVRDRFGAARDGVDADTLVRVAESYGLKARAFSCEIEALPRLPMPQVLFWNFDHFVVLSGFSRNRFAVKDPARGELRLGRAEFNRSFTGISIVFEPEASFERTGAPEGLLRRLLSHGRGAGLALAAVLVIGLLQALTGVLIPGFTRIFVDDYIGRGFKDWLLPLLVAMAVALVFRTVLAWLRANVVLRLQSRLAVALSARLLWHIFHLPFGFFAGRSPGEVSARMQHATAVAGTIANPLVQIGVSMIGLLVYGGAMVLFSAPLAAMAFAFAGLNLALVRLLSRRVREGSVAVQSLTGRAHAANIQAAALLEDYKATGAEDTLFRRLMEAEIEQVNAEQRFGGRQKLIAVLPILSAGMLDVVALGGGAWQVFAGQLTLGGLVGFQMLCSLFSGPLSSLVGLGNAVQLSAGAVHRLHDVLAYRRERAFGAALDGDAPVPETTLPARLSGAVEAEHLSYAYAGGPPVLQDVSFALKPGSLTAVIGSSGSGKSTLGRLLVGLMPPQSGTLRFDGKPAAEHVAETLRGSIAYVDQSPFLFAGKIRDNLSLWDQTLDGADLMRAAHGAHLGRELARRPGGIDGRIGENGSGLSGGERQRLAIARALALNPALLVLDESTSALDTLSEEAILDELRRSGATVVLITHRASVVRRCDIALVLDKGRLVGAGRPQDLARAPAVASLLEDAA